MDISGQELAEIKRPEDRVELVVLRITAWSEGDADV